MINGFSDLDEAKKLFGGKGEKLRPTIKDVPKLLEKIMKKPIFHYVVEHLKQYSIYEKSLDTYLTWRARRPQSELAQHYFSSTVSASCGRYRRTGSPSSARSSKTL